MARPKKKTFQNIKDCHCMGCGHDLPIEELYYVGDKSGTYTNEGYLPYCKTCCDMIAEDYLKEFKSPEACVYYTCAINDVPFIRSVYESMESYIENKGIKSPKFFKLYMNQYLLVKSKKSWKATRFADTDVALGDIKKIQKTDVVLKQEMEEMELVWGKQKIEDYQFLEYRWDIYTEGMALTPAQEALYRKLCLLELSERKKNDEEQSAKEEQEQILKLYKTLKLDNFSENKDKTLVEQMLEFDIAVMEENEPAEYYEQPEKYKDFLGIGKDNKSIMRSLKNLITGSREYPDINDDASTY